MQVTHLECSLENVSFGIIWLSLAMQTASITMNMTD